MCYLAMLIVDAPCSLVVRPCATTSACGLFCPVKRCEAPSACAQPRLLARASAVQRCRGAAV